MAAHGLDDRVAVLPRREAGADADDDRRVGDPCAKVALGKDGVHQRVGRERFTAGAARVGEHRDNALREQGARLVRVCGRTGDHILDRRFAVDDGFGEGDRAADGRRALQIGQHDPDAAAPKAQRDAGGEIARPADQRKHRYTPLCRLPAVTGQVSRFASAAARS